MQNETVDCRRTEEQNKNDTRIKNTSHFSPFSTLGEKKKEIKSSFYGIKQEKTR
jgi:hypothetical protein